MDDDDRAVFDILTGRRGGPDGRLPTDYRGPSAPGGGGGGLVGGMIGALLTGLLCLVIIAIFVLAKALWEVLCALVSNQRSLRR